MSSDNIEPLFRHRLMHFPPASHPDNSHWRLLGQKYLDY